MFRLIAKALVALALLAGPAAAQTFTLPELGLQNSGACRQLAARDRTSNAMIALGCLDTVGKGWNLTPKVIQLQGSGSTGDVSSMSAVGIGETTLRSFANRLLDIPISVDSFRGGTCANAPDDTCATQAAINAAAAQKREVLLPGYTLSVKSLTFPSNVTIRGRGEGVSTLQLKAGTNSSLLASVNAYSLFGTNSQDGVLNFVLSDFTLDGNRANNTIGDCLAIYGSHFRLRNITMLNCPEQGMHTGWGPYGSGSMEASYDNILVDTTGKTGVTMEGPHDSVIHNMIIIDGGQGTDNTYAQLYLGSNMNGRFSAVHTWHRSTVTNRTSVGLLDASGTNDFTSSHFEGSNNAAAQIAGNTSTYSPTVTFYSPWKTGSASVVVSGSNNQIRGTILGSLGMPGQPPRTGVYLGPTAAGNTIEMLVLGSSNAALDVTAGDAGFNQFKLTGAQSTGPGVIGSLSQTSSATINMYGATSAGQLIKDAAITAPSASSSACSFGQRAFDSSFEYRCVAANTWKRAALSTW